MKILPVSTIVLALSVMNVNGLSAKGFLDDFGDMDATDGDPVTWVTGLCEDCTRDASSGDYVLTPNIAGNLMTSDVDREFSDLSIKTRIRLLGDDDFFNLVGVFARTTDAGGYYAGVQWYQRRIGIYSTASEDILASVRLGEGIQLEDNDVNLQFDLFGNALSLTAWLNDDPKPSEPQLSVVDDAFSAGSMGLYYRGSPDFQLPAAFRFVEVVPEPSTCMLFIVGGVGLLAPLRRKK